MNRKIYQRPNYGNLLLAQLQSCFYQTNFFSCLHRLSVELRSGLFQLWYAIILKPLFTHSSNILLKLKYFIISKAPANLENLGHMPIFPLNKKITNKLKIWSLNVHRPVFVYLELNLQIPTCNRFPQSAHTEKKTSFFYQYRLCIT